MSNIMSQIRFQNKPSRNSFDLSNKVAFTAKAGELLPFDVREIIPGDKVVIKPKWFTRTNPLNTAAYTRLTEYIDYYFVPYRILWNKSDKFFENLPDSQQALGLQNPNNRVYDEHPYFMFSEVLQMLRERDNSFYEGRQDVLGNGIFGENRGFQGAKLLQYLGYGDFSVYFNDHDDVTKEPITPDIDFKLNPFPLLAYQAVYQYFERFDQWEQMRSDFFNVDYLNAASMKIDVALLNDNLSSDDMFDMRYSNFKRDLFTGILPNSQYGEEATVTVLNDTTQLHGRLVQTNPATVTDINNTQQNVLKSNSLGIFYLSTNTGQTDPLNGNLSILALRQAEALQRYKEIKQSNKYDYRSQMQALWNAKVSRERANMPYHVGGFVNGINIDEVVNTSITDNGDERQSANIAGKGAGAGAGFLEFNSEENGILIGIYKVCPELDYVINGISKLHQKTNFADYANPMFDKLGMESVTVGELLPTYLFEDFIQDANAPLGYVPRYYEYKTSVDKILGGFTKSPYDTWTAPLDPKYIAEEIDWNIDNNIYTSGLVKYPFFKINPSILNPIFTAQIGKYEKNPYYFQPLFTWENEHFLINMFVECNAVRNLDYNGLPY